MKKILIFSLAYFPDPVGGAEIAIKEITDRISDIEFHLITHRFVPLAPRDEIIGNVRVHRIGGGSSALSKALFLIRAAWAAARLHRVHRFDGAWAMMSYMTMPLVLMRFLGTRLPYALTLQEGDTFEHMFRRWVVHPFLPLIRRGFKDASVIQAISNYLAEWPRHFGYTGVVEVIPNGAGAAFGEEVPEGAAHEVQSRSAKKMGDVFLITTSRLVRKNAVDDILRALPLMPENVRFMVIGKGEEEGALRKIANDLHIEHRVEFLGYVAHSDLPRYLAACDIFVRPSLSEGQGISFLEAMAAGLPVIATQEGGIADFLYDRARNPEQPTTGWAVDARNPEQIASAVKDIMAHPETARAVAATAKAMVAERYSWDGIARDMREHVFGKLFA